MPKFSHVMLDLETLSVRTNAALLQIAAIAFDIETGELGPSFCAFINDPGKGVHYAPETIRWWMQQPRAAIIAAQCEEHGVEIVSALSALGTWLYEREDAHGELEGLWSHGLTFDVPILADAFERNDFTPPWHYRTPRDTRTLFAVAPGGMPRPPKDETREHDALYDCEYQIQQVVEAWHAIGLANAAYERHKTGMSKVLDKILAMGLESQSGVDELGNADTLPEGALNPWGEGGMPAGVCETECVDAAVPAIPEGVMYADEQGGLHSSPEAAAHGMSFDQREDADLFGHPLGRSAREDDEARDQALANGCGGYGAL